MSGRQAALLVAELRSNIRTRDEKLTALEHDLNNEIGTLQLMVHLMRCNSEGADRAALLDALAQTTGRIRRLMDAFRR
jgi:hypothetical protein